MSRGVVACGLTSTRAHLIVHGIHYRLVQEAHQRGEGVGDLEVGDVVAQLLQLPPHAWDVEVVAKRKVAREHREGRRGEGERADAHTLPQIVAIEAG